jgi:hypothetical protein
MYDAPASGRGRGIMWLAFPAPTPRLQCCLPRVFWDSESFRFALVARLVPTSYLDRHFEVEEK